jgi:hypothetical protein
MLGAAWDPHRHFDTFGWRPDLGALAAVERICQVLETAAQWDGPLYVIRKDVRHAFESISHDLVLRRLEQKIRIDGHLLDLVEQYLHAVETAPGRGIGRGSTLAPLLADVALDHIDQRFPPCTTEYGQNCGLPADYNFGGITLMYSLVPAPGARTGATRVQSGHRHGPGGKEGAICAIEAGRAYLAPIAALPGEGTERTLRPKKSAETALISSTQTGPSLSTTGTDSLRTSIRMIPQLPQLPAPGARHHAPMGRTVSRRWNLAAPVPEHTYLRAYDDFVLLVFGGRSRATRLSGDHEDMLNDIGLSSAPHKNRITLARNGFDFLGVNIRLAGDRVEIKPSADKVVNLCNMTDRLFHKLRVDPHRTHGLDEIRRKLDRRMRYLHQAGADCTAIEEHVDRRLREWKAANGLAPPRRRFQDAL